MTHVSNDGAVVVLHLGAHDHALALVEATDDGALVLGRHRHLDLHDGLQDGSRLFLAQRLAHGIAVDNGHQVNGNDARGSESRTYTVASLKASSDESTT